MVQVLDRLWSIVVLMLFTQGYTAPQISVDSDHAFYLSVIEVAYPAEDGNTALRIKVFSNDLQEAISEYDHTEKLIDQAQLCTVSIDQVTHYLNQHVKVQLDGVPVTLKIRDCRIEGDSHWLTFQISTKPWKEIALSADFFMELFPTQTHVVNVLHGHKKQFARLTKDRQNCVFKL